MSFTLFDEAFSFQSLFNRQCDKLIEAATLLKDIFTAFPEVRQKCYRIQQLDTESRLLSREITTELSLTLIRPIDREEIHELNMAFGSSFEAIRGIATRLSLYNFHNIPSAVTALTANLADLIGRIQTMVAAINRRQKIDSYCQEIETTRTESNHFLVVGLGELYEGKIAGVEELLEIIKWSHLYDRLEEAIDRVYHLARILESIVLKNL